MFCSNFTIYSNTGGTAVSAGPFTTVFMQSSIIASAASPACYASDTGTFTFTRSSTAGELTVTYDVIGTAQKGFDCQGLPGEITFADGQASATIVITPIDDDALEGDETLTLTLTTGPYTIAGAGEATVTISEADLPSAAVKLDILQSTIKFLDGAGYVYIGMDHFALPTDELAVAQEQGSLHRNFQGYSTHVNCDLIGMGVTAIGHVCDNYSQNVRKLEDYYEKIDAGLLPLERGVELEPDDLLRREIIVQLMCHFVLDIEMLEQKWRFNFATHFKEEIAELENLQKDGLLTLDQGTLRILPAGRMLVRNVCMVFDRYLRSGSGGNFSKVI